MPNPPFSLREYLEGLPAPHNQVDNPLILEAALIWVQDNPSLSVRDFFKMGEK
jgi:hypothetical protein